MGTVPLNLPESTLFCQYKDCDFYTQSPEKLEYHMSAHAKLAEHVLNRGRGVHATDTIPAVQAWDSFSARVRDTIVRKSAGYGNAWQRQGYMGNLARVMSKAARAENMMWRDDPDGYHREEHGESVQETLHDLGALCAFLVANLEEGNRWGR